MKNPGGKNGSGLGAILSQALKSVEIDQNQSLDWFRFCWELSVGKEIAAVSRIEREDAGILHVAVAGREWVSVLEAMEKKIIRDINDRGGIKRLRKIVFAEGKIEMKTPAALFLKKRRECDETRPNPESTERNLQMIKDDDLREMIARLSKKLRWLPLFAAGVFFLSGCAEIKIAGIPREVDSDAFITKEVKNFSLKYGESNYKDPRSYFHYLKALRAETSNDFDIAAKEFAEVVQYDPKAEKFYPRLAGLYLRVGRFDEGIKLCEKALAMFAETAEMHNYLADMLAAVDRKEEALTHYLKVFKLEPANIRSKLLAGELYYDLRQYESAREMFGNVVSAETDNPLGLHYLGKVLMQSGNFNLAEDNFRKAVVLRPNFLEAREHLAWVLEKLGDDKAALNEYQMILRLSPDNARVREHLVQAYPEGNTPRTPGTPEFKLEDSGAHVKLGVMYYEQALYLKSLDEFRLIVAKENTFTFHLLIAKVYELLGRFDKSIQEMEVLRKEQPRSVDILLQMALFYSMNNQTEEAMRMIREAVQLEPENDQLHHSLALAHISLHQDEKAVQSLKRAIELNNKRDSYYFELGSLQERLGNLDEAIRNMKRVIELNPEHSNAHNFLGYIYSLRGTNLSEAVDHLEKALAIQPQNGYFLDSLGWIYFKKGEPEKAIVELKKAVIYTPPDPVLYDHLGEIHFALKNYKEAEKAWKASLLLIKQKKFEPGVELPEKHDLEEKIRRTQKFLEKSL